MSEKYLKALQEQLPIHEVEALLNPDSTLCVAIKTKNKGYIYANDNHLKIMGFSNIRGILHQTDNELYSDKCAIKTYQQDDEFIYSTGKSLQIEGTINPINQVKLEKAMIGAMYPLHIESGHPDAVLVMTKPKNNIISLRMEHLITLSSDELQNCLIHRSYLVKCNRLNISLARMEILCLAELLKGKNASQTAQKLGIKQLTVESYLSNLRNKCAVGNRNELIQFFIDNQILESIVV